MEDTKKILQLMHDENLSYLEAVNKLEEERLEAEHQQFLKEAYAIEHDHDDVGYVGYEYDEIGDYDW